MARIFNGKRHTYTPPIPQREINKPETTKPVNQPDTTGQTKGEITNRAIHHRAQTTMATPRRPTPSMARDQYNRQWEEYKNKLQTNITRILKNYSSTPTTTTRYLNREEHKIYMKQYKNKIRKDITLILNNHSSNKNNTSPTTTKTSKKGEEYIRRRTDPRTSGGPIGLDWADST